MRYSRLIIMAICLLLLSLAVGCPLQPGGPTIEQGLGLASYDAISGAYPQAAGGLAGITATTLASRYRGRTLYLVKAPGVFGESFAAGLAGQGINLAAQPYEAMVRVGYLFDFIQGESRPTAYLQIQTSDGGNFGQIYYFTMSGEAAPVNQMIAQQGPWLDAPAAEVSLRTEEIADQITNGSGSPAASVEAASSADHQAVAPKANINTMQADILPAESLSVSAEATAQELPLVEEYHASFLGESAGQNMEQAWTIEPGSLKKQLEEWAGRAGFQLIWKADHDYIMEAKADFQGNFNDSIVKLFTSMHKTGNAVRATIFEDNRVIEVVEE